MLSPMQSFHTLEDGLARGLALSNAKMPKEPQCHKREAPMNYNKGSRNSCLLMEYCLPPRKRVRFSEHTEPLSHHSSWLMQMNATPILLEGDSTQQQQQPQEEEDYSTWYQKSDLRGFLRGAAGVASTCTDNAYLDLLAGTYTSCCMESESQSALSDHCAQELALLTAASSSTTPEPTTTSSSSRRNSSCCNNNIISTPTTLRRGGAFDPQQRQKQQQPSSPVPQDKEQDCTRGLERLTSPLLVGCSTKQRRQRTIASVVLAQDILQAHMVPHQERYELLRLLSEEHTGPAKKFARALGMVDAMSALVEYRR